MVTTCVPVANLYYENGGVVSKMVKDLGKNTFKPASLLLAIPSTSCNKRVHKVTKWMAEVNGIHANKDRAETENR